MFFQPYGMNKYLSLQSQVMVTRVIVRVVGRQKGGAGLATGEAR